MSQRHVELAFKNGPRDGLRRLAVDMSKSAKRNIIKGPKSGKLYRVPGRKRRHRASAPGQPPANLTGKLQKSVGYQLRGNDQMKFGYRSVVNYGRYLELGTSKMLPRKNLSKVVASHNKNAVEYLGTSVKRRIDRASR